MIERYSAFTFVDLELIIDPDSGHAFLFQDPGEVGEEVLRLHWAEAKP